MTFFSYAWMLNFPSLVVKHLPYASSDHYAILLNLCIDDMLMVKCSTLILNVGGFCLMMYCLAWVLVSCRR